MRPIVELLGHLRSQNVALSLDGDALKCSAPTGVLTAELKTELGQRKPEIVAFLRSSLQARLGRQQSLVPIEKIDRSGPLPLSLAQQRLWFLNQLDSSSSVYNIGVPLRLRGHLKVPALERSLKDLVLRHENLRTNFIQTDGEPSAVIGDGSNWMLRTIDARHLTDDGGPASPLLRCVAQQYHALFDITRDSLFRATLLIAGVDDHILVFTFHHMIFDGWSAGVLLHEFATLYKAYSSGGTPSLAPLSIQYVDFAAWQRKWLESGELNRQLSYWKNQLAGAPHLVGFPADHRRPQTEMFRGRRSKIVVPRELAAALEQLSQNHGVTLFMTLLGAFNVLLSRYSGQDDIVVGSPSANRSRAELNELVGFFVNNLVLRSDLSGNPSFAELLVRVHGVTLRAYEHQDVPFDRLVQALHPARSLDHSPLFQVMFILQNYPIEDLRLAELATQPLELDVETARFDLTVEVYPRHEELLVAFDYNSDLYEADTIARIQRHFVAILRAICSDPTQRIGHIPMLSAAERTRSLNVIAQTATEIPELCFYERFEAQARATPDRVAAMAGEEMLSYRELDDQSNRIAAVLQSFGVRPGKLVAVFLERSTDLLAGILGIAKSGAAYVPLDPVYPPGRIANIIEDAKPLVVLTSRHLLPSLPPGDADVVCIDNLDDCKPRAGKISAVDAGSEMQRVIPDDLAYVIFTSGSTGRPKGVEITHRSLVNLLESMRNEPGLFSDDVVLAVTTVSFDIAALELLLPLYTGATVCIAQRPNDAESLLADIARYRPTMMQATPATWKLLIAAGWKGDPQLKILCGGETLDADLARSLVVRSGALWNMYGPTETTIWSALLRVEGIGKSAIPIGPPIQNTSFYVLDRYLQPVPQGVAGELWIGGAGLARGYFNRPDLTAERFTKFSWVSGSPTRLYRTGDLVRRRADGTLDFLGRLDHQVKLRGFRIEMGEIENALRGCPGVSDAVSVRREEHGDPRLVAYLAIGDDSSLTAAEVRDRLRVKLPEYMVPSTFIFLKELPRLPNGKLDRAGLPIPEGSANDISRNFTAPATPLEQAVAAAFRKILQIEKVGLDDNFFDLGAHSLQIVKVHGELNRSMESKVPLISFFQYPTIRTLAKFIMERCGPNEAVAVRQ